MSRAEAPGRGVQNTFRPAFSAPRHLCVSRFWLRPEAGLCQLTEKAYVSRKDAKITKVQAICSLAFFALLASWRESPLPVAGPRLMITSWVALSLRIGVPARVGFPPYLTRSHEGHRVGNACSCGFSSWLCVFV